MADEDIVEFCPACGAPIERDTQSCPLCKLEYKAHQALIPDMQKESESLISLFKVNDSIEAELIRTLLEDAEVPCVISDGGISSYFGAATASNFSFTQIKILVPASHAKDAINALAEHKQWSEEELNRYLSMLDELNAD